MAEVVKGAAKRSSRSRAIRAEVTATFNPIRAVLA
jgi:hypothetical protein